MASSASAPASGARRHSRNGRQGMKRKERTAMRKRRSLLLSFGLGAVLALGVTTLRSITHAQDAPAADASASPAAAEAPAPEAPAAAAAPADPVPDPTGENTGTAADVPVKDPKAPTLEEVMATVGHNKI